MKRSTKFWIFGGVVTFLVAITCLVGGLLWIAAVVAPDPIDEYQVASGSFELRARALREGGMGLDAPGGIYHYECRSSPNGAWRPITSFRFSHPNMIPRNQVRFVGDKCIYFFHEFTFGVSTDGGLTWHIRGEPQKSFDTLHQWAFPKIESVTIGEDGHGTMHVSPWRWQTLPKTDLTTDDFGQTWR